MDALSLAGLSVVLLLALWAEFVNGWTDAPNAIATVVATRVISPKKAVCMAVVLNIAGTLTGTAVAETIGKGFIDVSLVNLKTIAASLIGLIVWSTFTAKKGLPTSESHALVAGLTGAGFATGGFRALIYSGWGKVLIGLVCSSIIGFTLALLVGKIIKFFFAQRSPTRSKRLFDRLQIASAGFMAYNHGLNDGQKFMGVFTLALVLAGKLPTFHIPIWVILLCAITMGIGTSAGGWKIIDMLGEKMTRIESWQGFGAEFTASCTILGASTFGIPISTTHTIGTSIMGAAASRKFSSVRWVHARSMIYAWIVTFPICALISAFIAWSLAGVYHLLAAGVLVSAAALLAKRVTDSRQKDGVDTAEQLTNEI